MQPRGLPPERRTMGDDTVTYKGVTYHVATNLPPLESHVETCSRCLGTGRMYGRQCRECNGRGLTFPARAVARAGTPDASKS